MRAAKLKEIILNERGNVESALVLIPLLTLFLIASQLTIAIHGRNMSKVGAQDAASTRAISGEFVDSDTYLHIHSPDPHQNLDLLVSHERRVLPQLISGLGQILGSKREIDVSGIAIIENQR